MPTRQEREDELARANGGVPLIGGTANPGGPPARSNQGVAPQPIVQVPALQPIGGSQGVVISSNANAPQQIAYYTTPDGVPREVTVIVAPQKVTAQGVLIQDTRNGVYAKITQGGPRGSTSRWVGAPCIVRAEGLFVKVEASIGACPFLLQSSSAASAANTQGQPTPPSGTAIVWDCTVVCNIIDGWTEEEPGTLLVQQVQAGTGNVLIGPCIVDTITLTNISTTATVNCALIDSLGIIAIDGVQMITSIEVPPSTTISVGRDILGPIGTGLRVMGFTGAPSPGLLPHDANDANIYVSVWGKYLGSP